ncbi:PQQ-binding-like beta-propeller repeat protein [Rubinisphaera margarita]|uniref:PQQ-binding-like beta-propeller repeat protein n=1 Tax=Rubinisphaera margarita TaxID=2909586 RepID=UPI001EE8E0DC|nr:PQQ-binding-like beta-propeller repeat protein [Rubinisphaera margarita]MCG6154471.1 PQQ-like beta-propeller repeat protein [Rubinisphaera margarita]
MFLPAFDRSLRSFLGLMLLAGAAAATLATSSVSAADWNQWRGPSRTGYLESSPELIKSLPDGGLEPAWTSGEIDSARSGGWGSPVVADGVVYLFTHKKELVGDPPPPRKYPWLAPDKRGDMTDEEYQIYEENRRNEDETHAKAYQFREFVMAYDAVGGKELWKNQSESTYTRFPQSGCPTVVGDRLYILGAGRQARCLDVKSGEQLWQTKLPGEFRDEFYQASVLVADDIAVFNATHLFGLSAQTGEIVWNTEKDNIKGTHASPAAWTHGGTTYLVSVISGGATVCLDAKTGTQVWKAESDGGHASPIVTGDKLLVYGNSRKKGLRCFQMTPNGAESLWVYQRVTDKGSTPIVAGNAVFVQGERKLACVDLETGNQLWMANLDMESPQWGSPIAAGNAGFYAYDGILAFSLKTEDYEQIFDAQIDRTYRLVPTAELRARFQMDATDIDAETRKEGLKKYQQEIGKHGPLRCATPAFADGFLYLRLKDGLACYDLRASKPSQISQR